jgi:hypothetical protein
MYDDIFTLSCPMVGPYGELERPMTMVRLIGAPVFNLKCELVGAIKRSSQKI